MPESPIPTRSPPQVLTHRKLPELSYAARNIVIALPPLPLSTAVPLPKSIDPAYPPVTSTLPVFGSVVIPLILSSLIPPITRDQRYPPSAPEYLATNMSAPPALLLDPPPTSVVPQ